MMFYLSQVDIVLDRGIKMCRYLFRCILFLFNFIIARFRADIL